MVPGVAGIFVTLTAKFLTDPLPQALEAYTLTVPPDVPASDEGEISAAPDDVAGENPEGKVQW